MDRVPDYSHRADRPPAAPWIMAQDWHHLLFAHWPVPPAALRPHLPAGLTVDTYDGQAWIGLIIFTLTGIRLRGTPAMPLVSAFPEVNIRTYVRYEDKPGVLFLTMDADNGPGIALAKLGFHLPYYRARMDFAVHDGAITVTSRRQGWPGPPALLAAQYHPSGPVAYARPGSLARWLTERYRFYAAARGGGLVRGDIHHGPWPLQPAAATIPLNTLAASLGLPDPAEPPLLHYAKFMPAVFWWRQRVRPARVRPTARPATSPG